MTSGLEGSTADCFSFGYALIGACGHICVCVFVSVCVLQTLENVTNLRVPMVKEKTEAPRIINSTNSQKQPVS